MIGIIIMLTACDSPIIIETAPSKPGLTSPVNSQQPANLILNWTTALRATRYDVYLGKTINTMSLIAQNITNTSHNVNGLDHSSLYFWRVVAKNDAGNTPSDTGSFSVIPQRTGNYIEIKDVSTTAGAMFSIRLSGNLTNVRAMEIILQFNPAEIDLAPTNALNEITFLGPLTDAFGLIGFESNTLTITLSDETNFSLNHEEFIQITCDAKAFSGVSQITIGSDSQVIDENFNAISFNKTDIGFVFVR